MSNTDRKFIPWHMTVVKTYDRALTPSEIKRLWQGLPLSQGERRPQRQAVKKNA